jgi:spore maturation protein CgeB
MELVKLAPFFYSFMRSTTFWNSVWKGNFRRYLDHGRLPAGKKRGFKKKKINGRVPAAWLKGKLGRVRRRVFEALAIEAERLQLSKI